jgi:hypothetical protein
MTLQECAQCVAKHGRPGCPATLTDERGLPCCAWCTDSEPCPIEQRRLKAAKKKAPEEPPPTASDVNSEKASEQESGVTTMKTPETDANVTPKLCKRPGCETVLSPRNVAGLCRAHVRYQQTAERTSSNGNGHAAAATNGSAKGNGHANGVLEDRLDKLILSIPASAKAAIIDAWIRGVI